MKCPVCGKKVLETRKYTDGSRHYIHKVYKEFGLFHLDGCFLNTWKVSKFKMKGIIK